MPGQTNPISWRAASWAFFCLLSLGIVLSQLASG